ncbi:hypothetical protein Solca_4320 [Solitalea canadensis DSM 3403]|uniref:Glycosyltransferase n=1 Tax=Solitalea canadensis (strain ATCC 29591 / DSM 3403 / JCM 21819 / LMG 8368 / NBRC 15130 / NCIMB 12057 / USAM 9D) TaxID=929556 RepID=H8KMQ7_SOLCM|nr:hypothetical protein Solca_4320 [Solitalea canadensis DSM 3403]
MKNICFFYPSKNVGGAQLLFVRLAIELSLIEGLNIKVIDYSEGFLTKQLANTPNVSLIPFVNGKAKIDFETILITPLSYIADIEYLVDFNIQEVKLLFWAIHPDNLKDSLYAKGRKIFINKAQLRHYIVTLSEKGNIIYMDGANFYSVVKELDINFKPFYLPIPVDIKEQSKVRIKKDKVLNLGWLGRISYDKINSLYKIIDEVRFFSELKKFNIHLHIIGDGEEKEDLITYLKKSNVSYTLAGTLMNQYLDNYIIENIDLGVAMGTSCIEFASRKIPVFLIDFSHDRFPNDYKYNWLFETEDYTLGSNVNSISERKNSFEQLIKQFSDDNKLGEKCYLYTLNNHYIKNVLNSLLLHCEDLVACDRNEWKMFQKKINPILYKISYKLYRKLKFKM